MSGSGDKNRPGNTERREGQTEGDVVTPEGDRRSAGISRERDRPEPSETHRDPRPGSGERSDQASARPEDLETHEEAEARRAAGGAPYEREPHPGDEDAPSDDGAPTPRGRPERRAGH